MEQEEVLDNTPEVIDNSHKDFAHNWVLSSRFLFYCVLALLVAGSFGGCYSLYKHRYMGTPEVTVPDNTLYNPKYK